MEECEDIRNVWPCGPENGCPVIKEEFCKGSTGRRVLGVCNEGWDSMAGKAIQEVQ